MNFYHHNLIGNSTAVFDNDTVVVVVHVRRGDYFKHGSKMYGTLTPGYYQKAWAMILARISLDARDKHKLLPKVVVHIHCANNARSWVQKELLDSGIFSNAAHVRMVMPNNGGRSPKVDVDMLSMSTGDYFILSNSTFGCEGRRPRQACRRLTARTAGWSHFFAECRRLYRGWWLHPWGHPRRNVRRGAMVLPTRWHKIKDIARPEVHNFMMVDYLFLHLSKTLYEDEVDDPRLTVP